MKRIAVIGIMGAGKSTLSRELGQILEINVYHLDKIYWKPGWEKIHYREGEKIQREIVAKEKWIFDGNWTETLYIRLEQADTIIFLDFPKWLGLYRIFKRQISQLISRKQPFDKQVGVKDRTSWKLIKTVIGYPSEFVGEIVDEHSDGKKVFIFKNQKQVNDFVLRLGKKQ